MLVSVDNPGCYCSDIGAGADDEQDDEEEGLEVEERGLQSLVRRTTFFDKRRSLPCVRGESAILMSQQ